MNSKPQYIKEDECELTWAMVLELQELSVLFGLLPVGVGESREAWAGGGTRGSETRCGLQTPKWLKLKWSCFAFFLIPFWMSHIQIGRHKREFGESQTLPIPWGSTCSSVDTEQRPPAWSQTTHSSRRVSGPPQFLMMLICSRDQAVRSCPEQIHFRPWLPSRAEKGAAPSKPEYLSAQVCSWTLQTLRQKTGSLSHCKMHFPQSPSPDTTTVPRILWALFPTNLLFPNEDHLYCFPSGSHWLH